MNDDTDKPLNTVGDDALEARITAWVLGEASSFEAGELEKLCAADPVLGLFERRLRVLHGLVAEDFKAGPAAEWKLSAARRAKITDLLGVEPEVVEVLPRRKRSRGSSVRGLILALAACVVIGVASYALLGGVGMKSDMAMVKESARVVNYSAPAPDAMRQVESFRLEAGSRRLEREGGAPVSKPDSSYAHLGANSPFTTKPPPAARAELPGIRGSIVDPAEDLEVQRKQMAEMNLERPDRDAAAAGVASQAAADAAADVGPTEDSIATLKKKILIGEARREASRALQAEMAERIEPEGIAGPPPAPATPVPAPAAEPAALDSDGLVFTDPETDESNGRGFVGGGMVGGANGGLPAELAPEIATRSSDDFISTVDAVTIPGIPAAPESTVTRPLTSGNRSGDGAVTRNNIDAVINDPARASRNEAKGEGGAALTGTFSDGAIAAAEKPMEQKPGAVRTAGAPESQELNRGPESGKFVDWLVAENAPGTGGGGGVPSEPQPAVPFNANETSTSRFKTNLRLGSERVLGREDATSFGDLESMGRLAEESKEQQNGLYYHSRADGQVADGIADLSDLAKKQSEAQPSSEVIAGRWFGTAADESVKGLKDANAPAGAPADSFVETPLAPGQPLGGLKRDLSKDLADAPADAEGEVRAKILEEVDKAWELSVPPIDAKEFDGFDNQGTPIVDGNADGPVPITPAPAVTDPAAMEEVRRKLYTAEGGYNLGKYDEAHRAYEEVLRLDPYNKAARRGMEKVAAAKSDYYRAAYDQTRAKLLIEEDEAPETTATLDKKKQAALDLMSEVASADEPFSTFSLHVSDASFKLAQAAMERGEVPAAEGIRPEEFYNAFDYGDPAPASGEPVVCVTEQSAHPAFAQRNLLRIGVRTGSQGRGASTPLNLTLLLDHSGSMEREDRNAGLAMAVRQLSGLLKEGDTITVAGFSRQPRLLADRLPGARAQELNELIARTPSEGGTNLEEGLKLGEELAKRQFNPAAQNRVVLFTDGAANLGDARPEALQARIEGLRQQGIAFDAAGFGADGLNDKLLERLTRNGNGRYYVVDGPEDADAGFAKQLAGAFRPAAENVKVQVRFNPARVAKYKLIGFEEHRLQKEDFRNDAVDAAEMAAEEAGNALYQIETLPQGEGEVGEVSVRFRDVASGQMVERTWTIPYDAQAPAFDKATPSIQLAGLAAFTAEKLRAAPMADAVDFQQLGQVYAGVRARYPNSQPVADLGSMIGKMK